MIIKPFLILLAALIFLWFLKGKSSLQVSAWKKIGSALLFIFALFAIVVPGLTNRLAHIVGVGRGADLLLYVLTLAFIGSLVGQYSHNKNEHARNITLARRVAIIEANADRENQQKMQQWKN